MRGVFDDREIQQPIVGADKELTLNTTTLLLIFFGLVLLFGLCFGLGYSVGHRGSQDTAGFTPAPGSAPAAALVEGRQAKPSANAPGAAVNAPADGLAASPGAVADAPESGAVEAAAPPPVTDGPGAVTPAPGAAAIEAPTAPASAAAGGPMVQIAAVSQQADADVLMGALRKRGYAVAAHREPLDGLIHVRIGPFKTRDEAEQWRDKLLNDGYNAIVQP